MSMQLVIGCDGTWGTFPCRAKYPTRTMYESTAIERARAEGWTVEWDGDACPAHTLLATKKETHHA